MIFLPETADIVVVGAGINGAAIAFELACRGAGKIVVVEAGHIASGASSRGAGIIRTYYNNAEEVRLAVLSLASFGNWQLEVGGDCGYTASGFLWIVGPGELDALAKNIEWQKKLGAATELLTSHAIAEFQPQLSLDGVGGAAYEPLGGYGDPRKATLSYRIAAERQGVRFLENTAVISLLEHAGSITGVNCQTGIISAGAVVLAAGAWSGILAARLGLDLPLWPIRMTTGKISHVPFSTSPVTFIDSVSDTFYRPTAVPGIGHISVRDERHDTLANPEAFDDTTPIASEARCEAIARLKKRIPDLVAKNNGHAWAAIDGVTPDKRAIYGKTDIKGLYICVGGNYKGFKIAPAVGKVIADVIVNGSTDLVDLAPFAFERFNGNAEFSGKVPYSLQDVM
jgi:sarcosine oxidase, subunit beta